MVHAYTPQSFPGSLETNTNYPPQHAEEGGSSPSGSMLYEDEGFMDYENDVVMQYEVTS